MIALGFAMGLTEPNKIALDIPICQPQHRFNPARTPVSYRSNILVNLWPDIINQKLNRRDRFERRRATLSPSVGDHLLLHSGRSYGSHLSKNALDIVSKTTVADLTLIIGEFLLLTNKINGKIGF